MKRIRKVSTDSPLRTQSYMDPKRLFTYFPKQMDSGKWVWWGYYWSEEYLASVEPRHMWIRYTLYSEEEYFLKRLAE